MIKMHITLGFLLVTPLAQANLLIPNLNSPPITSQIKEDKLLAKTGLTINEDDITLNQINQVVLNTQQMHEAEVWGLTLEEEKRYIALMQNRSGLYYQGLALTPLDILGINAKNEAERTHFAEKAAAQEAQKVAKNIAWNNAFYKAYNQLFQNVPVVGDFDLTPYSPYAYKPLQLQKGETLYFFIKPQDSVQTILLMLIESLENTPDTRLHIMLLDSDDGAIQLWANQHQIPQLLVNTGRLTLNHGNQNYQALKVDKKTTPLLLLSKEGASHIVDLGRF